MRPVDWQAASARDESFELRQLLGRGTFAHTYRARVLDPELISEYGTEEIALKIPHESRPRAIRKDFEVNAMLHLRLKPLSAFNLVRYLGVEIFRGQLVMAMEYVPDGSLRKRLGPLDGQKRQSIADAVSIAEGVLSGLVVIHEERIFHQDIKPENILMDGRTPKIGDLGIARILQGDELAFSGRGTLYYVSPESLGEAGADFRSDIWAVGVTLYEMVTGKLPFGNSKTPEGTMIDLIRGSDPVPAHRAGAEVPKTLSDLIDKALRKNPSERFRTAKEMRDALKSFQSNPDDQVAEEISKILSVPGADPAELESGLLYLAKRFPESAAICEKLGQFYNGSQRFADAVMIFKRGIECHPRHAQLHFDLALAYKGLARNNEFVSFMKRAVELDHNLERYAHVALLTVAQNPAADDLVKSELSKIRSWEGMRSSELESQLRDLNERFPDSSIACQELGEFYNGCHRFADAVRVFKRGIECHPSHAQLHLELALAHKGLGQNNAFVGFLKKAVELDHGLERFAKVLLLTAAE